MRFPLSSVKRNGILKIKIKYISIFFLRLKSFFLILIKAIIGATKKIKITDIEVFKLEYLIENGSTL